MSTDQSIWQWVIEALRLYVKPLRDAVEEGPSGVAELLGAESSTDTFNTLSQFASIGSTTADGELTGINSLADASDLIGSLIEELDDLSGLADDIAGPLFESLFLRFIWNVNPATYTTLVLIGAIDETQPPKNRLRLSKLQNLWRPGQMMEEEYGWGTEAFDADVFLLRAANIAGSLGEPAIFAPPKTESVDTVDPAADSSVMGTVLLVPLIQRVIEDALVSVGFEVMPVTGAGTAMDKGIAVSPLGIADFPEGSLGPNWSIRFEARGGVGYAVVFRPSGVSIEELPGASDSLILRARIARTATDPWNLKLGGTFNLRADSVELNVGCDLGGRRSFDAKFAVQGFEVQIGSKEEGDGFLAKVLPADLKGRSDFTIGWSPDDGFQFTGGGGFEARIPLHIQLGPISLTQLALGGYVSDSPILTLEAALDAGVELGPIQASISNVGVQGTFNLTSSSGTSGDRAGDFGPLGVDIRFRPPDGVGGVVDAGGVVVGGGFMSFDHDNKRYAGILQLNLYEIGLVAIGLITTRMPDGSDGFSMLVNIGIEFDPPFELSFGFTLSGVGGLIGINRTMLTDAIRDGFRNKVLDSILFPKDPIKNANKIISDLRAVFPPYEGQFVVGPLIKLGWGSPNLIVAELGLFLELPDPIRVTVLGQIDALFPDKEAPVIVIHVDVIGVFDPAKQYVYIFSTIYDSRIVIYPLSGDTAIELRWGRQSFFAMSLGGFHPRFSPPATLQGMQRLRVNIYSTGIINLYCEVYQALTSNSLQFGARLQFYAKFAGVVADGFMTFDALLYFSPFRFDVAIEAKVSISYKGFDLLSIELFFNLSGVTPWNARGKAKIKVLLFDFTAKFNVTWGRRERKILPAVDPLKPLRAALNLRDAWGSVLPPSRNVVAVFRSIEEQLAEQAAVADGETPPPQPILMHPSGTLELRQNVLPFKQVLDKLGEAPIKTHNKFSVVGVWSVVGEEEYELDWHYVKEDMARGQFQKLRKEQKLGLPSFEKMAAGIAIASNNLEFRNQVEPYPLRYESIVIEENRTTTPAADFGAVTWVAAHRQVRGNAAAQSLLRTSQKRRFEVLGKTPKVAVSEESYTIVAMEDMSTVLPDRTFDPEDVDSETFRITLPDHDFLDGEVLRFVSEGTLPGGLEADHDYFVVNRTMDDFQVRAAGNVAPVDLTGGGDGRHTVIRQMAFSGTRMEVDQALEDHLTAHPEQAGKVQVVAEYEVAV